MEHPLGKFNTIEPVLTIASASSINSGKYTLETIRSGCNSRSSDTLNITVNQPPDIVARTVEDNIKTCPGESIKLVSLSGPPLVNIGWTALTPGIIFLIEMQSHHLYLVFKRNKLNISVIQHQRMPGFQQGYCIYYCGFDAGIKR